MARLTRSGDARNKDQVALRLEALGEEAAHLASTVATEPSPVAGDGARERRSYSPEEVLNLLIEMRRLRFRQFETALSINPGWNMLLDLMSARLAGRVVPVSSAGVAAGVPATTALRLVNGLVEAGFIRRRPDPGDGRRVLVELTEDGRRRMDLFLRAAARLIG